MSGRPATGQPIIEIAHLRKAYASGVSRFLAIDDISFAMRAGERLSIVGPSGCGKTTLLKCISGLQGYSSGAVLFEGKPVLAPPVGLSIVFQDYARSLFPWMTVRRNVLLPLRYRKMEKRRQGRLADEALASVGLSNFADRYPWQLSGGMQQRVAIARALAYQPDVLLMDEPFASVDAQTRLSLEDLTLDLCARYGISLLLITHDIDEAVYMGDRVLVLSPSPASVRELIEMDLPALRDQVATKSLPQFAQLRARVYQTIHFA